jgi:hypothetical protein
LQFIVRVSSKSTPANELIAAKIKQ